MKKIQLDEEKVKQLLIEGKSCPEIALIFNVDKQVIQKRIRKLSIPDNIYIKFRPSLKELNQEEFDVLIGGLLGDSWIGYSGMGKNACGSFTHKLEHKDYVWYKYNFLKRLCSKPKIHNKNDKRTNRIYQQVFCKIATNPILNDIHNKFYKNGVKIIDEESINKLSPLGLAVWYMDDGTKTEGNYRIGTDCFSIEDVNKLRKMLELKFNIYSSIKCDNSIYIKSESINTFTNLIKPFIIDCMKYKLHPIYERENNKNKLTNLKQVKDYL